jgi:hypothetical protein
MDFLTQSSTEVILLIVAVLAIVGAVIYARHSSKPRLSANGLSGMRQQAMTTAQGVAMTQAVAPGGRLRSHSAARPARRLRNPLSALAPYAVADWRCPLPQR